MSLINQVIQSFPGLMAVKALSGEHIVVNENYKRFFPFDIHGLTIDDIMAKTDCEDVIDLLLQCKANDHKALSDPANMLTSIETFNDTSFESVRYIMKDNNDEFMALLSWDITDKVQTEISLNERLLHDDLTGIANKIALMQRSFNNENTIVYLDLDNFKRINDTLGHLKGDEILTRFALFINAKLRDKDTIYRVGGDEFVVVFEGVDAAKIDERLNQIRDQIEQDIDFLGSSFSFGTQSMHQDISLQAALKIADKKMFISKAQRNAGR